MADTPTDKELIHNDVEQYLQRYLHKELIRFVAVGSVDDGKSTLIGRLLHDAGVVHEDQLEAAKKASKQGHDNKDNIDFSLLTDGLQAEREQGITIDVAYRYFSTDRRKFIIADTPGHVQYTRNMVTGASTADVALILVDARLGILPQSKRHALIASMLGIPCLTVCVNKMDLVGYDQKVFDGIVEEFSAFSETLRFRRVDAIPVSALKGVNVVTKSDETPWYKGKSVLAHLDTVDVKQGTDEDQGPPTRFPVQYVVRPDLNYRGYAGTVVSGILKRGDRVVALPSGKTSTIDHIDVFDGETENARQWDAVTLRLADQIDISRGDMLVHPDQIPSVRRTFTAKLVWMSETPLDLEKSYFIKHTTQRVRAQVAEVRHTMDMDTLEPKPATTLELNGIGEVQVRCHRPLFFDDYRRNRTTGAFIMVDPSSNHTVGAGMITETRSHNELEKALEEITAGSGLEPKTQVSAQERLGRLGQSGHVLWLVGRPGSGRWPLAYALERELFDDGRIATVVNPTDQDLRSSALSARTLADGSLIGLCAQGGYTETDRRTFLGHTGAQRTLVVYVNTSEEVCRRRRPEGQPERFDAPEHPAVTVSLDNPSLDEPVRLIMSSLRQKGVLT